MDLQLTAQHTPKGTVLRCAGRLVAGPEIQALEATLDRESHGGRPIILNLKEVTRLDSTGMGALVRYTTTLDKKGIPLRLAAVPPVLIDLIHLTHLDKVLHLFPSEDDALASSAKTGAASSGQRGPAILLYDPSADLCAFVRGVLSQAGFDVRCTCSLHDAKTLLQGSGIHRVLIGPGTPHMPSAAAAKALQALVPKATFTQLDPGFRTRDAKEASQTLLRMFA